MFQVFSNYTERQVELNPVDNWLIDSENKAIVTMEADVVPSDWDWIGVFKVIFNLMRICLLLNDFFNLKCLCNFRIILLVWMNM